MAQSVDGINNKNALKHGAYALTALLPGEDPEEFKALLDDFYDEWCPEGPSEKYKVDAMAMCRWRELRHRRYLQKCLGNIAVLRKAHERADQSRLSGLTELLEGIESGAITEDNLNDKMGRSWADEIRKKHPRKKFSSDDAWQSAVSGEICRQADEVISGMQQTEKFYEDMCDEVLTEGGQDFQQRNDAQFDRLVKALGMIKTMKSMGLGKSRAPAKTKTVEYIESPTIQKVE